MFNVFLILNFVESQFQEVLIHKDSSEVMCALYFLISKYNLKQTLGTFGFRFSDLTGTDYSEGAISLAQHLASRNGFSNIKFLVCLKLEDYVVYACVWQCTGVA